jgi:hypothetical protein
MCRLKSCSEVPGEECAACLPSVCSRVSCFKMDQVEDCVDDASVACGGKIWRQTLVLVLNFSGIEHLYYGLAEVLFPVIGYTCFYCHCHGISNVKIKIYRTTV